MGGVKQVHRTARPDPSLRFGMTDFDVMSAGMDDAMGGGRNVTG
jgi:hypothetical protein